MIRYVTENKSYVTKLAVNYFRAKRQNLGMWTVIMTRKKNAGDELALFLLCKLYNRHAVIYNSAKAWCTIDHTQLQPNSRLDLLCDIVLVYRNNGFCEATKIVPSDVATPSVPTKQQRKTVSIKEVLEKANERENTTIAKRLSAQISTLNIIPDGPRVRNTRDPIPLRQRSSTRCQRETHKNINYSDNIDNNLLDSPKQKKKKSSTAANLREPSRSRQMAQRLLTRSQLQQSAPPGKLRTIIGTAVKEEDKKPKLEEDFYEQDMQ